MFTMFAGMLIVAFCGLLMFQSIAHPRAIQLKRQCMILNHLGGGNAEKSDGEAVLRRSAVVKISGGEFYSGTSYDNDISNDEQIIRDVTEAPYLSKACRLFMLIVSVLGLISLLMMVLRVKGDVTHGADDDESRLLMEAEEPTVEEVPDQVQEEVLTDILVKDPRAKHRMEKGKTREALVNKRRGVETEQIRQAQKSRVHKNEKRVMSQIAEAKEGGVCEMSQITEAKEGGVCEMSQITEAKEGGDKFQN